ncbi:MAG: TetR/AcrR family transcriptional regulator [Kiritimatiellae bacterium]|nr:TetR/AcrR family transcriptional regulator [Kiritimatiellia bacterium]
MGIVIDHNARKRDIIAKAINLFAEQGYNGVTYQKIADNCSIARTTLYKYFHSKRDIFNAAIWEVANLMIDSYAEILPSKAGVVDRLNRVVYAVLGLLFENRVLLTVILDYVLAAQRAGHNMRRTITRHTIGLRRILHRLVTEGVRTGELRNVNTTLATGLIYSQLEAAVLRLTVSQNADYEELSDMLGQTIANLKANPPLTN